MHYSLYNCNYTICLRDDKAPKSLSHHPYHFPSWHTSTDTAKYTQKEGRKNPCEIIEMKALGYSILVHGRFYCYKTTKTCMYFCDKTRDSSTAQVGVLMIMAMMRG